MREAGTSRGEGKVCVICGEDCSDRPRVKDRRGRYYCKACHDRALILKQHSEPPGPDPTQQPPDIPESNPYAVAGAPLAVEPPTPTPQVKADPDPADQQPFLCPGCDSKLAGGTRICVHCGINVDTGRSVVTSRGLDEVALYTRAEGILRPLSWLTGFGFSPIASEALGHRRPYTTWAIAILTCLITIWFWFSTDSEMLQRKNLMLWGGNEPASADLIIEYFEWTRWGDIDAMEAKLQELDTAEEQDSRPYYYSDYEIPYSDEVVLAAHAALTPEQRTTGYYQPHQLLTHAVLHADIFHLAGNLIFLMIFGSRVNALIGSLATILIYPLLAVAAGGAELLMMSRGEPTAMLGASGAIMGMAGMYFVLFPVNRIHMAGWFRWWFYFRMKIWVWRGFWVVLAYFAFDMLFIFLGTDSGTAHMAHAGGFVAGAVVALILLLSRVLCAGGADILSVVLGRYAWPLIGRPRDNKNAGLRIPSF